MARVKLSVILTQLINRAKLNPNRMQTATMSRGLKITTKYHKGLMGVQLSREGVYPSPSEILTVREKMPDFVKLSDEYTQKKFKLDGVYYIQLYFEMEA